MNSGGLAELDLDDALVEAVRRGDDGAFGELVSRHQDWLMARCRRHLGGDAHAAEDVVQECLVALQRTLRTRDAPMRVRPWLTVVARNRCIDETRKLRAVPTSAIPETPVFDRDASGEDEFLARAWTALTGRHRRVLELRELAGLSYEEIAANLAVTSGAVEALLFRARSALRREYARAGGKVAALGPMQEAVARATGGSGVVTEVIEHGHDLVTAIPALGSALDASAPALPSSPPSGAVVRLASELHARLMTTPGIDGVLAGPAGGSGRLRGALVVVGLLLGGVATAVPTVTDDKTLPAPPPVVVTIPEPEAPPAAVPAPPTTTMPSTPAPPAPPAAAPAVPESPSAPTEEVPPPPASATAPSLPPIDAAVPAAVDGIAGALGAVVEAVLAGVGEGWSTVRAPVPTP